MLEDLSAALQMDGLVWIRRVPSGYFLWVHLLQKGTVISLKEAKGFFQTGSFVP